MLERAASDSAWRMGLFAVEDDGVSLPFYNHTVWQEGRAVGVVTSGAYGFRTGKPLVLAYLTPKATSAPMSIRVIDRHLAITELREANSNHGVAESVALAFSTSAGTHKP